MYPRNNDWKSKSNEREREGETVDLISWENGIDHTGTRVKQSD